MATRQNSEWIGASTLEISLSPLTPSSCAAWDSHFCWKQALRNIAIDHHVGISDPRVHVVLAMLGANMLIKPHLDTVSMTICQLGILMGWAPSPNISKASLMGFAGCSGGQPGFWRFDRACQSV